MPPCTMVVMEPAKLAPVSTRMFAEVACNQGFVVELAR
jgi:hypothetical protein